MFRKFLHTEAGWTGLILRVTLGAVMWPHGAQKALGWFGGGGFPGTLEAFSQGLGIPAFLTVLVIASEFFGSLGLVLGLATRLCAFGALAVMLGAIFMVHLPNGFFMNWFGRQAGEGFEYHLLAVGIAAALMFAGGGRWSVDEFIENRL